MRRILPTVILVTCLAAWVGAVPRTEVKRGNQAARLGNASEAVTHYVRALEEKGDTAVVLYDIGNALYDQGQYDDAVRSYLGSFEPGTSVLKQSETLYNLGNAFFQAQQYDKSVMAYKESLKRNPSDAAAKYNLELALQMMRQQQQPQNQQNQQQKQDQKDQQQKQDQQQKPQSDQEQQQQQQQNAEQQDQQQQSRPQLGRQMSREEAERLLNALLQNEQDVLKDAKKIKVMTRAKREKDW